MTRRTDGANRPTTKQLTYLRSLATRTGQTFAYPHTATEASREIRRLQAVEGSSRIERRIERDDIIDAVLRGPEDSARVRSSEITGWGSAATWRERS